MQYSVWIVPAGEFLLIPSSIIEQWSTYKQNGPSDSEAGGILLGHRRDNHIEIVLITEPYPEDVQQRYSFERVSSQHSKTAIKAWSDSSGYIDYLGEWHTHPEDIPCPSVIDINNMEQITDFHQPKIMVSVIIGTQGHWVGAFQMSGYNTLEQYNCKQTVHGTID